MSMTLNMVDFCLYVLIRSVWARIFIEMRIENGKEMDALDFERPYRAHICTNEFMWVADEMVHRTASDRFKTISCPPSLLSLAHTHTLDNWWSHRKAVYLYVH